MYSMKNGYSFWDLLKITFNSVYKLFMFLKVALDDGKGDVNLKIE